MTVASDFGDTRLLWEGQLVRLEAEIDERSRMIYGVTRLRLEDNEDIPMLPVGMFVQAEIRGRKVENIVGCHARPCATTTRCWWSIPTIACISGR